MISGFQPLTPNALPMGHYSPTLVRSQENLTFFY